MSFIPYSLRSRILVAKQEEDSSSDETEFFDSNQKNNMANEAEISLQLEALKLELNQLREAQSQTNDSQRSKLQKVHVPNFNKDNPNLWFAQIERSFVLCDVVLDDDKFDVVAVKLEGEILLATEDLIINPPSENKFAALKERIISKFGESSDSKLRRLIQGNDTAGLKPSDKLAHMKRLAPGKENETLIRTMFLAQMPESIRPFLTVWEETDLDKLAKTADKMLEANNNNNYVLSSVSSTISRAEENIPVDAISNRMKYTDVCQAIKDLSDKVEKIQHEITTKSVQTKPKLHSRAGASSTSQQQICFYHKKFGDAARKCKSDCPLYSTISEN